MRAVSFLPPLAVMFDSQVVRIVVWTGMVVLTIALLVLMRTRWGQSQPLRKCIVLSLLAHLLLGIYTTTVTIVSEAIGPGDGLPLRVALHTSGPDGGDSDTNTDPNAFEPQPDSDLQHLAPLNPAEVRPATAEPLPVDTAAPTRVMPAAGVLPSALDTATLASAQAAVRGAGLPAAKIEAPPAARSDGPPARPVEPGPAVGSPSPADTADPPPTRASPVDPPAVIDPLGPIAGDNPATGTTAARVGPAAIAGADPHEPNGPAAAEASGQAGRSTSPALPIGADPYGSVPGEVGTGVDFGPSVASLGAAPVARPATDEEKIPSIYQLRLAPDHTRQALAHGGTRETEAAVVAALRGWPLIKVPTVAGTARSSKPAAKPRSTAMPGVAPAAGPTRESRAWRCWPCWPRATPIWKASTARRCSTAWSFC